MRRGFYTIKQITPGIKRSIAYIRRSPRRMTTDKKVKGQGNRGASFEESK
jgi:hypothetical protein